MVSRLVEIIVAVALVSGGARWVGPGRAAADFNADPRVDERDVSTLTGQWLSTGGGPADLTDDQLVNMDDFALLGQVWRTSAPGPVITEFVACNKASLLDAEGDSPDWIEICNPTGETLDLDGWFLTDDVNDLEKWELPALQLALPQPPLPQPARPPRSSPLCQHICSTVKACWTGLLQGRGVSIP